MIRTEMPKQPVTGPEALAERLRAGDRRALARAISLVENGDPRGAEIVSAVYPHTGEANVIGLTGPPGAGKSTLVAALTRLRRQQGHRVGVLAIDPSSPFTHGALLGDRIRLTEHFLDEGVFIRSMATRGALGGLSEAALQTLLLLDAAGRDTVLLETVGVGQAEVDVVGHADTVVLVLRPGSGDSVQALKAGVMEIPDVIAVNKADDARAATLVRELKRVLALSPRPDWQVPVLATDALTGAGVEELEAALAAHRESLAASGDLASRRAQSLRDEVLAIAARRLRLRLEAALTGDAAAAALLERVVTRELDPASAAEAILREFSADLR